MTGQTAASVLTLVSHALCPYVQRVATVGGVAPAMACGASNMGAKQIVKYQADYIFWKAA